MARWMIIRDEGKGADKVRLVYQNLVTGLDYNLGRVGSDVPDSMLIDWIFTNGNPDFGDRIRASDGTEYQFQRPQGVCA